MKKLFFSIFALIGFAVAATAQQVTVADVEVMPGNKVKAILNLEAPANTYTGAQLELQFPETGFSIEATEAVTGWVGSLEYNIIGSKVKIAAAGSKTFTTATIGVEFSVASDLALEEYDVTVNGVFEGGDLKDQISAVTFKVNVTDRITLDENSTVAPSAALGVNVKVKRTINAGEWSTIVLPFTLSKTKAETVFGSDVKLAEFTGFEVDYGDDEENVIPLSITINFAGFTMTSRKGMAAGKPFLIKTSQTIESFVVDGVNLVDAVEDISKKDENDTSGKMTGTFVCTKIPADGLFINKGKFYYSVGNTSVKAFRCWFELGAVLNKETDFVGAAARVKMSITDGDGNTTNIDPRTMQTIEDGKVYNMNGQYVGEAEDANSLPKGIYIVNGKKKVIK